MISMYKINYVLISNQDLELLLLFELLLPPLFLAELSQLLPKSIFHHSSFSTSESHGDGALKNVSTLTLKLDLLTLDQDGNQADTTCVNKV